MTLKISCIKLIREDIRRRGWFAALTCVVLVFMMPIYDLLYISSFTDGASRYYIYNDLPILFPGLLNGRSFQPLMAVIAILAVLAALTGFAYIHSKEKLDFYHAFPVKRTRWFASAYLSGLLIFLVPYAVCSVLTVTAGAAEGIMTAGLTLRCAQAAFGGMLAYFIIYNTCVFAVMLTGRTVIGLLASLTALVYPTLVLNLLYTLQTVFFKSYYSTGSSAFEFLPGYLSPVEIFYSLIEQSSSGVLRVPLLAAVTVLSALLVTAAVLLYRIYPSEAAGTAVVFPAFSPILKGLVCIPAAPFLSILVLEVMAFSEYRWIIPLSLLTAVLICTVIEFIYQMDLKLLLKGWRSSLISIGGVLAILCIFQFDLFGYDRCLPGEDSVETVSFCPDSFSYYFTYPDTDSYDDAQLGFFAPEEYNDTLYALMQSGIENIRNGITPQNIYTGSDVFDSDDFIPAVFRCRLSGGRTFTRRYIIGKDEAEAALSQLMQSRDYREQLFPVFHLDKEQVASISMTDAYGIAEDLKLTKEQCRELLDAYKKDVLEADADTLINGSPVGELSIGIPEQVQETSPWPYIADTAVSVPASTVLVPQFYFYPEYTNTLELLREFGCTPRTEILSEDVSSLMLSLSPESIENGKYSGIISELSDSASTAEYGDSSEEITVTDKADIALVLDHTERCSDGILDAGSSSSDYLYIQYPNGDSAAYSVQ